MPVQKKSSTKNSQRSGIILALWIMAAIILLVVFLINQNKILANLKATDFFARVFGKTPAFVENTVVELDDGAEIEKNDVEPESPLSIAVAQEPSSARPSVTLENEAARIQGEEAAASREEAAAQAASQPVVQPAATTPVAAAVQEMTVRLYFMEIESDGSVERREVTRTMRKSDSPLADTLNALIAGPTASEEDMGCRSLISNGTRLIGASVKNGVATLNFSGEFEFNQFGVEGTRGQLQQIVYTATAFPTVNSVQFLVDGENREYLGSEGVWIGTPLNRNSF